MSELYLVRHAQASFGAADYDRLSELGHRQARWLGEYFGSRDLRFDRVVCGTMVRHRETAAGIFEGMGMHPAAPDTDANWDEFDFEAIIHAFLEQHPDRRPDTDAAAQTFAQLLRDAMQTWAEDSLHAPLPERWQQFEERVERGLADLGAESGARRRVLVVSSGGPISMALRHVLQAPASAMVHMNLQLRNSSISRLYLNAQSMHYAGFNHLPHLDLPKRAESVTYY